MPYLHFMCDEIAILTDPSYDIPYQLPSASEDLFGFYTWQKDVALGINGSETYDDSNDWNKIYKSIISANVVLSSLSEFSPKDDDETRQAERIKGEALFNRAADLFLLVNLYGDAYQPDNAAEKAGVPIKLTEYAEIGSFKRASVKEVYQQIISDLTQATDALKNNEDKSIYRINYTGACLFFSRVYLYMQDYTNAISWAKTALEGAPEIEDLNSFSSPLFDIDNSSIIFTMGGNIVAENTYEYYSPVWESIYLETGQFVVSTDLYNVFDDNDLRKSNFFHTSDDTPGIVYYDKQSNETTVQGNEISDCFTLRTAEAWLNLAEAYACSGDNTNAQNAINTLLKNRIESSAYQGTTLTGADLVHFIRQERRKELCMEGHRWFDLRRYQVNSAFPETVTLYSAAAVVSEYEIKRVDYYKLEPNDPAWTLPLPKYENDYNDSEGNIRNSRLPYESENY